jgi:hypothetical protein
MYSRVLSGDSFTVPGPHVLARVDARRRVEPGVLVELLHHLAEGHAVLRAEVQAEARIASNAPSPRRSRSRSRVARKLTISL